MNDSVDIQITPEPEPDDQRAVIAAVHELLRREAELAQPSHWRIAGWVEQRVGITDLRRWIPQGRRWPLSARLPAGGRLFPGLNGRGDAK